MDLSKSVINGLGIIRDNDLFIKLSELSAGALLNSKQKTLQHVALERKLSELPQDEAIPVGLAEYKVFVRSIMTALVEGARCGLDVEGFATYLEQQEVDPNLISRLSETFQSVKPKLELMLSEVGSFPLHAVDVEWGLDYVVKSNMTEHLNQPKYHIKIKTESVGKEEEGDAVGFQCNPEQLQDLVSKLKDACKAVEKAATV